MPLADFPDRTDRGSFGWDRVVGVSLGSTKSLGELETSLWLDDIWIDECPKDAKKRNSIPAK